MFMAAKYAMHDRLHLRCDHCVYAMWDVDVGQQYCTALYTYLDILVTNCIIYEIQILIAMIENFLKWVHHDGLYWRWPWNESIQVGNEGQRMEWKESKTIPLILQIFYSRLLVKCIERIIYNINIIYMHECMSLIHTLYALIVVCSISCHIDRKCVWQSIKWTCCPCLLRIRNVYICVSVPLAHT